MGIIAHFTERREPTLAGVHSPGRAEALLTWASFLPQPTCPKEKTFTGGHVGVCSTTVRKQLGASEVS